MDSIMENYYKLIKTRSDFKILKIDFKKLQLDFDKANLELQYKIKDSVRLELQKKELEKLLKTNAKIHEADIMLYKQKAKGKFKSFLLGTAIGAVIVAILKIVI